MRESYGIEVDSRTGKPEFFSRWSPELQKIYLRGKAKRGGADVDLLDEIIHDVIKNIGPKLARFSVDLPALIAAAIRELKTRQKSSGPKQTCSGRCDDCRPKCWET
jgi:hypothetical protein